MLLKNGRRISYPILGYLLLLLQFALLGTFVAALGLGSGLAVVTGIAWVICLVASVGCFRIGSRKGHVQTIWSEPLRQDEINQYYVNFRGGQRPAGSQRARQRRPVHRGAADSCALTVRDRSSASTSGAPANSPSSPSLATTAGSIF